MKSDKFRLPILLLALAGLADCLLLSYWYLTDPFTHPVRSGDYSKIAGVPNAILGAAAYLAIALLAALEKKRPRFGSLSSVAVFIVSGLGTFFSIYLTFVAVFVIRRVCPYCLFSSLAITAIFICSIIKTKTRRRETYAI